MKNEEMMNMTKMVKHGENEEMMKHEMECEENDKI